MSSLEIEKTDQIKVHNKFSIGFSYSKHNWVLERMNKIDEKY